MPTINFSRLTAEQVADVRRKLESAGCPVPPSAHRLEELAAAIAAFR